MLASIRPYFITGVALAGASVIAVTPIQAAPTDIRIANPAVELAAIPSPCELYPQLIAAAAENAKVLAEGYFRDPVSILSATVEVQFAALADAVTALEDGESAAFLTAIGDAVTQPIKSLATTVEFIAPILRHLGPRLVDAVTGPPELGFMTTVAAIVDVVEAALAFDLIGTFDAVVNIPARIIDGVLNGEFDSTPGHLPGLLENRGGLIAVVAGIDREIGVAIRDSATSADDELPDMVAGAATSISDPSAAGGGESVSGESDPPAEDRDAQANDIEADSDIDDGLVAGEPANDETTDKANGEASEPQVADDTEMSLELDELAEDAVTEELEKAFGATANETADDNLAYDDAVPGIAAELVDVDEVDGAAEDDTAPTSDLAA